VSQLFIPQLWSQSIMDTFRRTAVLSTLIYWLDVVPVDEQGHCTVAKVVGFQGCLIS
jgi:hypothetical protein